jgi:TolB-like protein
LLIRLTAALLSFSILTLTCGRASAEAGASVIVLGLRSVEGDDDIANLLTDALRDAAHQVPTWKPVERAVSMTQMTLAHGCDDIDASCLSDIARGLDVEFVVYGTLRRTSARSEYDFQISLSVFNANTGSIDGTETDTMPRTESDRPEALGVRAKTLLRKLSPGGASEGGTLSIQVNTSRAEVRINGQVVGQTQNGQLIIEGVPEGEHDIEIFAAGRGRFTQRTRVSASGQTNVVAQLAPAGGDDEDAAAAESSAGAADYGREDDKPKSLRWLGYTLLGVGGAALVGTVTSWIILGGINGDATFKKYRAAVGPSIDDICGEADDGRLYGLTAKEVSDVSDMCGTGGTFEVLQWVFLIAAVGSGGAGAYILLTDKGDQSHAEATPTRTFALTPAVSRRELSLTATLRF